MAVIVWATTKEKTGMEEAVFVRTTIDKGTVVTVVVVVAVIVWLTIKEETRMKETVVVQTITIQGTRA